MASRKQKTTTLADFSKGLVTIKSPAHLKPDEAAIADNVDLELGTIRRRSGWVKIHTANLPSGTTEPVRGLFSYYKLNEVTRLFAIAGTYLMVFESEGPDFATVSSTFSPSGPARATFIPLQDSLYIFSKYGTGSGTAQVPKKWTQAGGLVNLAGVTQIGWISQFYEGALWMAGDTANPSRLHFSKQAPNQETWPSLNWIDIAPGDGDKITGIGQLLNSMIIFKERAIHRITGTPPDDASIETGDIKVKAATEQVGCIAPLSVASSQERIIYLARDGIYSYNGIKATELSKAIRPLFLDLKEDELQHATGFWVVPNIHYVLTVQTIDASKPDLVISVRMAPTQSITLWKGLEAYAFARYKFTAGSKLILGTAGAVGKFDESYNTDNGKRISWKYRTGVIPLGGTGHKLIRRGWVFAKPGGSIFLLTFLPDFQEILDEGGNISAIVVDLGLTAAKGQQAVRRSFPAMGLAQQWQLEIAGNSDFGSPEVHEVAFEWFPKDRH